jgi:hypothetical protein
MNDIHDNLPATSAAYEELGPIRRSTSSERPVPPKIARLIGELGLRYRPSVQADMEAHAATLALLTRDVSHLDPNLLEAATRRWVQSERFMPKAAELIELCRKLKPATGGDPHKQADEGNERLRVMGRGDIHWVVKNGQAVLEWRNDPHRSL